MLSPDVAESSERSGKSRDDPRPAAAPSSADDEACAVDGDVDDAAQPSPDPGDGGRDGDAAATVPIGSGSPRGPWRRRLAALVEPLAVLLVLAGVAWHLVDQQPRFYTEPDCDGYLIMAKAFAQFQLPLVADDPFRFQEHLWVENLQGQVSAKFSPGYPLFLAIAYRLGGDAAMPWVSPVALLLGLLGSYLLFRLWMSRSAAWCGLLLLAINPGLLFYGSYMLTHVTNLCCTVWGIYGLCRWLRFHSLGAALLGGLGLGMAMAVRYTNAMLILPLLIAAAAGLWEIRHLEPSDPLNRPTVRRRILGAVLMVGGFAAIGGLLAAYHWVLFDSPLTTGYALSDEQTAFTLGHFFANYAMLLNGLMVECLPILMPLGLFGMVLRQPLAERLIRISWFLPGYLLYSAYYWAMPGMAYYRFTIYLYPVIVGGALLLVDQLPTRAPWRSRVLLALLVLGVATLQAPKLYERLKNHDVQSRFQAEVVDYLATQPADAALYTHYDLLHYVGTQRAYIAYDIKAFSPHYNPLGSVDDPRNPRVQPIRRHRFEHFYATHSRTQLLAMLQAQVADQRAAGHTLVLVVPEREMRGLQSQLGKALPWEAGPTLVQPDRWGRDRSTTWAIATLPPPPAPTPPEPTSNTDSAPLP